LFSDWEKVVSFIISFFPGILIVSCVRYFADVELSDFDFIMGAVCATLIVYYLSLMLLFVTKCLLNLYIRAKPSQQLSLLLPQPREHRILLSFVIIVTLLLVWPSVTLFDNEVFLRIASQSFGTAKESNLDPLTLALHKLVRNQFYPEVDMRNPKYMPANRHPGKPIPNPYLRVLVDKTEFEGFVSLYPTRHDSLGVVLSRGCKRDVGAPDFEAIPGPAVYLNLSNAAYVEFIDYDKVLCAQASD
jgi:hypothetical protein